MKRGPGNRFRPQPRPAANPADRARTAQTKAFLTKRFEAAGVHPKTRFGQNFLIDLNLHRLLVDTAELDERDVVLEIGAGTGAITSLLAERAAAVIAVEIDDQMANLATEQLADCDNVTLLRQDALQSKHRFDDRVIAAVSERLAAEPNRRFKLVANLPYNVATPICANLLALDRPPHSMTVTIQKELADRFVAKPRSKDYGALSVWIQAQARPSIVRVMPPQVFWPRPKVDSAIVHVRLAPQRRADVGDLHAFHEFTRSLFAHRRKFLRSVMVAAFKNRLEKPDVDAVLEEFGLGPSARAEELSVPEIVALSQRFQVALAQKAAG